MHSSIRALLFGLLVGCGGASASSSSNPASPAASGTPPTDASLGPNVDAVARCTIDEDGVPRDCRFLKRRPGVPSDVLRGVESIRYKPAIVNGKAVAVEMTIPLRVRTAPSPSTRTTTTSGTP